MDKQAIKILTIVILVHISFFCAICFFFEKKDSHSLPPPPHVKPDPISCVHPDGIDLSHHNIAYDWSKVDAKFVYVRASMGSNIKDKRYDIHRKAARRHNIPVGAYLFLTAKTSAKTQFELFSSIVKKDHFQLRPKLDIEEGKYWNAPKGFYRCRCS